MSYLEIVHAELKTSEAGNQYKRIEFAPVSFMPNGKQVLATGKARARNVFPDATRLVEGVETFIKGDLLFSSASVGEVVEGSIDVFETTKPYQIEGKEFHTVTVVSFAKENPAINAANLAGVPVRDGDEIVAPTKVKSVGAKALI